MQFSRYSTHRVDFTSFMNLSLFSQIFGCLEYLSVFSTFSQHPEQHVGPIPRAQLDLKDGNKRLQEVQQ